MREMSQRFSKLRELFLRYPSQLGVHPGSFGCLPSSDALENFSSVVAIQSVPDKFFFLLFGAFAGHLKAKTGARIEVVVVRAISGGIGNGWIADIKRSFIVSWLASSSWIRAYGRLVDGVAYRSASLVSPVDSVRDRMQANALWRKIKQQDVEPRRSLLIGGVEVADLLVDSYLRFKPSPEFDAHDPFVRRLLLQAVRDVRRAHRYFRLVKPKKYLTSYSSYLEHGIPARVALLHGISVWSFGNIYCFGKQLRLGDTYSSPSFESYRDGFEALDRQTQRLEEARTQLELRLAGGIDAATSYMRRSAYGTTSNEPPPELGGAVVVFLHDFYDSPHVYPDLVFDDFWSWACFTIDTLINAGIPFFLKPHPNQISCSNEAIDRLQQRYTDLRWIPRDLSNIRLAQLGIACGVTVYGTVAHELAYLGVPSICCARHPHHSFEFSRTARTRGEYKAMLQTYSQLPVSKAEMRRQALAFYYMHNLYGDDEEKVLQRAFVEFWRACNIGKITEEVILHHFQKFVSLPAFGHFVANLADYKVDTKVL
jgi:hypothetical protein